MVARGALALLALALVTGCSSSGSEEPTPSARAEKSRPARDRLQPARCPAELGNCATASGRILYVERVDPDGDGDAHFVLVSRAAITGPGSRSLT